MTDPTLRLRRILVVSVMTLLWVPCDAAPTPPAEVTAALRPYLLEAGLDPDDASRWPGGLATALDVTADGIPDWVIDFVELRSPKWCSTGGCRHQVWVSDRDTYRLVCDEVLVGIEERSGAAHTLDLDLHGNQCALPGNAPCIRSFEWDRTTHRLVEVPDQSGDTLLTGPVFQPIAIGEDAWPDLLANARHAAEQRCIAASGGDVEWDVPPVSVPDLDGDGARDWVLDESYLDCSAPATGADDSDDDEVPIDDASLLPMVRVFVSNHGRWRESMAVPATGWAVDIATRPASLVLTGAE